MRYHTEWRQFFFITIAVSGRRAILSRIVEDAKYPPVLPPGEAVRTALRALHGTWPEVTLSNYVIMPDHVHFLMIIDPARCITGTPTTPLYATHRMMDEAERRFGSPIFERQCYVELSFSAEQLCAIRRYIALNPARALWKVRNPDMFVCRRGVKTALLLKIGGVWDAIGDITLLASPFLMHVRLTMKKPAFEHEDAISEIIAKARQGMIAVSGFISPGEREALRRLKATPGARFIKVLPYALPHRYDPSAEDSRELAAHRMLIISDVPLRQDSRIGAQRAACLAMNARIAAMCQTARDGGLPPAAPPAVPAPPRGISGGRMPRTLHAFALAAALVAASFTPLPDEDVLEPSIQNEVEHALSRAYSATNAPAATPAPTNYPPFKVQDAALSRTDLAIRLVSGQKADGRWYDGTNDVTAAVIAILEVVMGEE